MSLKVEKASKITLIVVIIIIIIIIIIASGLRGVAANSNISSATGDVVDR